MTTEDDFQRKLDASPEDWQTRVVFADWLQEKDDPRADGYRALGAGGFRAHKSQFHNSPDYPEYFGFTNERNNRAEELGFVTAVLPDDWYEDYTKISAPICNDWWNWHKSRSSAEDAAALAFARLPVARRAELLAGAPAEATT
jgi:uncharacterized protein (TIGR02996 family)